MWVGPKMMVEMDGPSIGWLTPWGTMYLSCIKTPLLGEN